MREWLERKLPLMWLTDIYVPPVADSKARIVAVFENLDKTDLAAYWKNEQRYIDQQRADAWRKPVDPSGHAGS